MKKVLSLLIAVIIAASLLALPAYAAPADYSDYIAAYDQYRNYYDNTYKPAYYAYNDGITDFIAAIDTLDLTDGQLLALYDFVVELQTEWDEFFGDRVTAGTSRYIVPSIRNAMYAAASNGNYDSAISLCADLTDAVELRMGKINELKDELEDYDFPDNATAGVQAMFTLIDNGNAHGNYEYRLVITNNTPVDITNWTMTYTYDGLIKTINSQTGTSGSYTTSLRGRDGEETVTFAPSNRWQGCYTIPAGESITIGSQCTYGTVITDATFNGQSINVGFTSIRR